jgi:site-specific DNA recombinase
MTTTPRPNRATRRAAAERAAARAAGSTAPTAHDPGTNPDTPAGQRVRVAIYVRISTDEEHQPFSKEAQETRLRAYIGIQPGWELVGPIYDDEKSGATLDRPGLQQALAAAKAGRFDILLVYRVDRLSRSLRGLVDILDQLDADKVGFRSATEPVDTSTAVGRMLVQMLGVFAQFERETIIDRVINGMERKAAKGQWCGGYRPYGYQPDPATGMLVPVEAEATIPQTIFTLYTRDRLGARAIGNLLTERGLRTKAGKPWNVQAVLTVLRNRVYLGEVYFRGTWYRAEHHHQPLVDPDVFEQAQQILTARGDDHAKRARANSDYTLAGQIVCDRCGKKYVGTSATGSRYRYRYYTCFTRQRYGPSACDAERLPADQLEHAVLTAAQDTFHRSDLIQHAIKTLAETITAASGTHRAEIAALDAEITALGAKTDNLLTAIENGLDQAHAIDRITTNQQQLTQLRDRRQQLADLLAAPPTGPTPDELTHLVEQITAALKAAEPADIKKLFEQIIDQIHVTSRNSIKPVFRVPTRQSPTVPEPQVRTPSGRVGAAGLEPAAFRL